MMFTILSSFLLILFLIEFLFAYLSATALHQMRLLNHCAFLEYLILVLCWHQELMEKLKMPSDAQLMQTALNDLNNSSLSLEDQHRALEELLILVEPIDNSNGNYRLIFSFIVLSA